MARTSGGEEREKITVFLVATTFAMQPVCKAARAAHALRSDHHRYFLDSTFSPEDKMLTGTPQVY
jgi:hypothetical protein